MKLVVDPKMFPKTILKRCAKKDHPGNSVVWVGGFTLNAAHPDGLSRWCIDCNHRYEKARKARKARV